MKSHLLLIDNDPIQAKVKRSTLLKYFDVDLCTNLAIAKQHIEQRTNSGINAYHKPYELVIIDLLPIRQKTIDLHELYQNILPEQYPLVCCNPPRTPQSIYQTTALLYLGYCA